jgi:integrase
MAKGSITKRGDRAWLLTYDAPRGSDGKRNQRAQTFHGTKKQAEARMAEIQHSINKRTYFEAPQMTVKAFSELWVKGTAFRALSDKCRYEYPRIMEADVIPVLGNMQISEVKPFHIETLLEGLFDRGLSGSTVEYSHRVVRSLFKAAVHWEFIASNPLDKVSKPSRGDCEVLPFTPGEASRIVAAAEGSILWLAVVLALYGGLRRAEALGLFWSDVDFARKEVTVRRNLVYTPAKGASFGPPKTRMSRRTISAPAVLLGPLREYHDRLVAEYEALGLPIPEQVCALPGGKLLGPTRLSTLFSELLRGLELRVPAGAPAVNGKCRGRTFHDLRHTHATTLLQARVPLKVTSQRLGHSSVVMTLQIYAHVMPGDDQAAAAAIDNIFCDVNEQNVDRMLTDEGGDVV